MNIQQLEPSEVLEFLILNYLQTITGCKYSFAIGASKAVDTIENVEHREEGYFQIMADSKDKGFFQWYLLKKPYNQFFDTMEEAFLAFVEYYNIWDSENK